MRTWLVDEWWLGSVRIDDENGEKRREERNENKTPHFIV